MTLHHDVEKEREREREKKIPCSQHQFLLKVAAATVSESDCVFDELVLPGRRCPGLFKLQVVKNKKEEEAVGIEYKAKREIEEE